MISIDLSNKLKVVSLMSILLVIYLHSYNIKVNYSEESLIVHDTFNYLFQGLFSHGITRIAVPYFFLISGFLFFYTLSPSYAGFVAKFRSRFQSLVVPYSLWFLMGYLLFGALKELPFLNSLVSTANHEYWTLEAFANQYLFGTVQYQFWFLRHLVVYVMLSPIIYVLLKYLRGLFVTILLIIWFCHATKYAFIHSEGLFFFTIGGFVSLNAVRISEKFKTVNQYLKKYSPIIVLVWIALCSLKIWLCYKNSIEFPTIKYSALTNVSILIGIVGTWSFYEKMRFLQKPIVLDMTKYTFFIYALHEPLLLFIKKVSFILFHFGQLTFTVVYFVAPIVAIIISLNVAKWLEKYLSAFYRKLVGGRV